METVDCGGKLLTAGLIVMRVFPGEPGTRTEDHTPELQSPQHRVCRLLLGKKQA